MFSLMFYNYTNVYNTYIPKFNTLPLSFSILIPPTKSSFTLTTSPNHFKPTLNIYFLINSQYLYIIIFLSKKQKGNFVKEI